MKTLEQDIQDFHSKFQLEYKDGARQLPAELQDFRSKFLQEELDEYNEAVKEKDLVKQFDALIDLVYVAIGTAYLQGLPFQLGWTAVHAANMLKVRAERESDSKRGSTFDVVKPEGWQKPDPILARMIEASQQQVA